MSTTPDDVEFYNDGEEGEEGEEESEEDVESKFVDFLEGLAERMDNTEVKVQKMDKALASSLRAMAGLVQDIVVYVDENTPEDRRAIAISRIHKFVNTIKAMDNR
jgi:hypothetical protein